MKISLLSFYQIRNTTLRVTRGTLWIKENIEKMNIVFVSHLGDLVQNWYSIDEWENANRSMSVLDGVVSWGVLPGNHDGFDDGNLLNYNYYFAYERFSDESWYGGAYQNNNTNSYQLFSGGGEDYIIFHLQYSPTQNVLSWASDVIDLFPEKKVIISTHEYIFSTHEYMVSFLDVGRSEIGEIIWEKLVKPHFDQIFLVLCGHNSWFAENTIVDFVDGAVVYQLLSDYQDRDNGGNGWLRILEFSPEDDK
ncbi:MAG: metallophosphoesterase, partial [Candidatus Hodarchaeales archaeon]